MMREVEMLERNKRLSAEVEELREDLQGLLDKQRTDGEFVFDSPDEVKLTRIEYEKLEEKARAGEISIEDAAQMRKEYDLFLSRNKPDLKED
jgi:predicted nuclease with TOPRIM domain